MREKKRDNSKQAVSSNLCHAHDDLFTAQGIIKVLKLKNFFTFDLLNH